MADTQEPTITAPAPDAASIPDATITPSPAPVVTTEAPVIEAPVADTAPAVESAPAAAVVAPAAPAEPAKVDAPITSVLGEAPAKVETPEKKVDVKPEGDKPVETKVEAPTVELPVYEPFKLPENITLEKEPLDSFTKILGEIETGKLDHKGMQEKGQALIDLATQGTLNSINRLNDSYVQIHNEAKKARFESLKADPELGGDKLPETISALQKSVAEYGGTEGQIADFRKEVSDAGIDASPALCRLIYNMQQKINKYTTEDSGGRMVPGAKPAPSKVKDYQRFYAGN